MRTDLADNSDDLGRGLAVQADGKIVVAGSSNSQFALVRYRPTGELDGDFGDGGRVTTAFATRSSANAVLVQPDGKLVAAGTHRNGLAVVRYDAGGSLDDSFGTGGTVTVTFPGNVSNAAAYDLALQADGKIVVAGGCGEVAVLARLNSDGSLDSSFGAGGRVGNCFFALRALAVSARVALQPDGKIVTATVVNGSPGERALRRYHANGSLDVGFGSGGFLGIPLRAETGLSQLGLCLQPDGKILIAGMLPAAGGASDPAGTAFGVLRFNADGSQDVAFGTAGQVSLDFTGRDSATQVLVQSDGRIVVVGLSVEPEQPTLFNLAVTRLSPNGLLNNSLGVAGQVGVTLRSRDTPAAQAVLLSGDRLLVVGSAPGTRSDDFFVARFTLTDTYTTANQRYVGQLYLNLLGRSADSAGLTAFAGLLDRGEATRLQVAQAFVGSEEYRTVTVQHLYRTLLKREADQAGLGAFVGFLGAGGTIPQLKAILLGSAEYFQNRAGNTADGFVTAVYRDVLGREPDAGGRQFFTQSLNSGLPRALMAGQVVGSQEGLERIAQGWYRQYLRRSADVAGLSGFVGFLQAGGREEAAVASFFSSGEFTAGL